MKLGRLNHIGVATPAIADSIVFYRDVTGACTCSIKTL
jgi:methylmalonyl-CoA/ethylmalonyl-CoA epimerase